MRHLILILAIILTYNAPNNSEGAEWFFDQSKISMLFVLFLYICQRIKYQAHLNVIVLIEILSTVSTLIAAIQYTMAHKTAFIYTNYEHIMTTMFIAELAIIMGVLIRDVGHYSKRYPLHLPSWHFAAPFFSDLSIRENPICKTP